MKKTLQVVRCFTLIAIGAGVPTACTVSSDNLLVEPDKLPDTDDGAGEQPDVEPDEPVELGSSGGDGGSASLDRAGGGAGGAAGLSAQGGMAGQPPAGTGGQGGAVRPVDPVAPPPLPTTPVNPPPTTPTRATSYEFEQDTEGWQDLLGHGSVVSRSTDRARNGASSLKVQVDFGKKQEQTYRYIGIPMGLMPKLKARTDVKFHVSVPVSDANQIAAIEAFVQADDPTPAGRTGGVRSILGPLGLGGFVDITVTIPATFPVNNLKWMGVQIIPPENQKDGRLTTIYVDSVSFEVQDAPLDVMNVPQ